MRKNRFSRSHNNQVLKLVFTILVSIFIYLIIKDLFGKDSLITKYFFDKVVLTPYNVVGIILIILFSCGIWVGYKNSKILFSIISFLFLIPTLFGTAKILFPNQIAEFLNGIKQFFINVIIVFAAIVFVVIIIYLSVLIKSKIQDRKYCKRDFENDKSMPTKNISNSVENGTCTKLKNEELKREEVSNESNEIVDNNCNNDNNVTKETILQQELSQPLIEIVKHERYIANRTCPQCGSILVSRKNRYDDTYFLGCSKFGKTGCDFTINYVDYYDLKEKYNFK